MHRLPFIFLLLFAAGCAVEPPVPAPAGDEELAQLAEWLSGDFENAARARQQEGGPAPQRMVVLPFREPAGGERWLYVAQWTPGGDEPSRRFAYRIKRADPDVLAADLFALRPKTDLAVVPTIEALNQLPDRALQRRRGCRIWLSRDGLSFNGGTRGPDCHTDYRDAARVRIELVIRENETMEWLQGFDAQGERLWGGDAGARVYRRAGN